MWTLPVQHECSLHFELAELDTSKPSVLAY